MNETTLRLVAAFALLLCTGGLGVCATIINFEIVDAVNAKLPDTEKFEPLGWYYAKTLRLHREYRRLCPGGRLLQRQGLAAMGMLATTVLAALALRFWFFGIVWVAGGGSLMFWFMFFRQPSQPKAG